MAKNTVAVRGVANRGPMQRYTATPKAMPAALPRGGGQRRHAPAHAGQGHHCEQRQAHTGEQKAQGGRPQLLSCRQPDHGRKNDVASPQKEGKSHKAKGQNVPEMEVFRRHDGRDCDKNKLHILVSWRFKK